MYRTVAFDTQNTFPTRQGFSSPRLSYQLVGQQSEKSLRDDYSIRILVLLRVSSGTGLDLKVTLRVGGGMRIVDLLAVLVAAIAVALVDGGITLDKNGKLVAWPPPPGSPLLQQAGPEEVRMIDRLKKNPQNHTRPNATVSSHAHMSRPVKNPSIEDYSVLWPKEKRAKRPQRPRLTNTTETALIDLLQRLRAAELGEFLKRQAIIPFVVRNPLSDTLCLASVYVQTPTFCHLQT